MFRDLRSVLERHKIENSHKIENGVKDNNGANNDVNAEIACQIVEDIFGEIGESVKKDRSSVKINMIAKGFINSLVLNPRTIDGTNEFLRGMRGDDIDRLLNKIQERLNKRK